MNTKQAYQKEFEARLEKVDAQIAEMRAKADQAGAEAKADYYERLQQLSKQRDTVAEKLGSLKSSSEAAWENVKDGLEGAYNELQTAFEKASSQFTSKSS